MRNKVIDKYSKKQLQILVRDLKDNQRETRLWFLTELPVGGRVAEIGVARGMLSECILRINRPKEFHLIDCWEHQERETYVSDTHNVHHKLQERIYKEVKRKFRSYPEVNIHRMYSRQAAEKFPDGYFDWIYIDADHSYEAVKSDLDDWYPKVKGNGIIAGHDYTQKPYFPMGVIRAVDEFCEQHKMELFLIDDDPWHSWAIRSKNINKTVLERSRMLQIAVKRGFAKSLIYERVYELTLILKQVVSGKFRRIFQR